MKLWRYINGRCQDEQGRFFVRAFDMSGMLCSYVCIFAVAEIVVGIRV